MIELHSLLNNFTKFFTFCLLSFTIIFFPVVRVITVSGVSSTISNRCGFRRTFTPFSFVTSIIPNAPFHFAAYSYKNVGGRPLPPAKGHYSIF